MAKSPRRGNLDVISSTFIPWQNVGLQVIAYFLTNDFQPSLVEHLWYVRRIRRPRPLDDILRPFTLRDHLVAEPARLA